MISIYVIEWRAEGDEPPSMAERWGSRCAEYNSCLRLSAYCKLVGNSPDSRGCRCAWQMRRPIREHRGTQETRVGQEGALNRLLFYKTRKFRAERLPQRVFGSVKTRT